MTFPTSLDSFDRKTNDEDFVMAGDINELQAAIEGIEAKLGIDSSAVTSSIDYKVNNFFESGRVLYVYEHSTTVPTGWSYKSSVADRVLAVRGGSSYYSVNGGTMAGTFNHTHTVDNHRHLLPYGQRSGTASVQGVKAAEYGTSGTFTSTYESAFGGAGFTHNRLLSGDQSTTCNTGNPTTYRVPAAVGILIEKD